MSRAPPRRPPPGSGGGRRARRATGGGGRRRPPRAASRRGRRSTRAGSTTTRASSTTSRAAAATSAAARGPTAAVAGRVDDVAPFGGGASDDSFASSFAASGGRRFAAAAARSGKAIWYCTSALRASERTSLAASVAAAASVFSSSAPTGARVGSGQYWRAWWRQTQQRLRTIACRDSLSVVASSRSKPSKWQCITSCGRQSRPAAASTLLPLPASVSTAGNTCSRSGRSIAGWSPSTSTNATIVEHAFLMSCERLSGSCAHSAPTTALSCFPKSRSPGSSAPSWRRMPRRCSAPSRTIQSASRVLMCAVSLERLSSEWTCSRWRRTSLDAESGRPSRPADARRWSWRSGGGGSILWTARANFAAGCSLKRLCDCETAQRQSRNPTPLALAVRNSPPPAGGAGAASARPRVRAQ